ncbi:isoprenyl transferase [Orenia marismortui]|uniref:Isoprenyl transferase n=1 Tax=Orenia marismortui TaxID=46469 RepID=A0A4R8GZ33_9FIRM|nr:isoprenyl transferase [Orenia marismortui]TDX51896.1 undecaprenyl diphosphate synthase [Orenia marismortui]
MWDIIHKFFNKVKDKGDLEKVILEIKKGQIPDHVAIIMDGNGRWAKKRGLPRTAGHQAGVKTLKEVINLSKQIGVGYITAYAFSTENWKRPKQEVDFLMSLFERVFLDELDNFNKEGVKINIIGYKDRLPKAVREKVKDVMEITKDNKEIVVNIALDYGSRAEIIEMVKEVSDDIINNKLSVNDIDEELISNKLYTTEQPDPDLLIRPGGEKRISNFLLWQIAYAEIYFSDTYWPDFDTEIFLEAIIDYQKRERRFGGLKKSR